MLGGPINPSALPVAGESASGGNHNGGGGENARVDGATDFQIFTKIILPLSFPALASFAIFQFLWTWNDLLVAKVFLIDATGETTVMTNQIVELLGTRGGNWEILATAAFVSIAVPLLVFFAMQKYLVRGLLAGSVK